MNEAQSLAEAVRRIVATTMITTEEAAAALAKLPPPSPEELAMLNAELRYRKSLRGRLRKLWTGWYH